MGRYLWLVSLVVSAHGFGMCNGVKAQKLMQIQSQLKSCNDNARSDAEKTACESQANQACQQAEADPNSQDNSPTGKNGVLTEQEAKDQLNTTEVPINDWVTWCKNGNAAMKKTGTPVFDECDAAGQRFQSSLAD